jgi:hypothetical protein
MLTTAIKTIRETNVQKCGLLNAHWNGDQVLLQTKALETGNLLYMTFFCWLRYEGLI